MREQCRLALGQLTWTGTLGWMMNAGRIARVLFAAWCLLALEDGVARGALVDAHATPRTARLFTNLKALSGKSILFGHEKTTLYGLGWKGDDDRSDVKAVCGDYPAVYGWDLNLFVNTNPNKSDQSRRTTRDLARKRIQEAYARGGVNTVSWHMWNPVTGRNFYDTTATVGASLPGGARHAFYRGELDKVAEFLGSLKGPRGEPVPVVFRPFHEHTGGWFWWGKGRCGEGEYVKLWRFTVEYLRDEKGVHNLLYAFSPSLNRIKREADYLYAWPGDSYVDVAGGDSYRKDYREVLPALRTMVEQAEKRGKVPALTEFGYPKGLPGDGDRLPPAPPDWYTRAFLGPVKRDPVARRIVYAMTWQNANREHFWVPDPPSAWAEDFRAFHADPFTVFGRGLPDVYRSPGAAGRAGNR
jgi:mannan endo-1,4-beta-mannosidase